MPTIPESHRPLLDSHLATLATNGPDGRPQLSTVWFLADDGTIRFSLNTTRQKTKNLMADPRITVHIQDPDNPIRYLEVRGDATVEPDDDYEFASKVGAKYGVPDMRVMDAGGGQRVVVSLDATRVNAIDLAAG